MYIYRDRRVSFKQFDFKRKRNALKKKEWDENKIKEKKEKEK